VLQAVDKVILPWRAAGCATDGRVGGEWDLGVQHYAVPNPCCWLLWLGAALDGFGLCYRCGGQWGRERECDVAWDCVAEWGVNRSGVMSLYAPSFHGLHHQHENHGRILLAASSSLHLLMLCLIARCAQQCGSYATARSQCRGWPRQSRTSEGW
jgi:hypothetical protein